MFSRLSQFLVRVADLAEAEGRVLREAVEAQGRAVGRNVSRLAQRLIMWAMAAVVSLVALGFLAAGLIWLLAWLVTWPVALLIVAGLLFIGVYLLVRLAGGAEPGTLASPHPLPPPTRTTPTTASGQARPTTTVDAGAPPVVDAGAAAPPGAPAPSAAAAAAAANTDTFLRPSGKLGPSVLHDRNSHR